ncbi:MAG: hypothetical protein WCV00_04700 [Verrucomicrobiia bacterium]|jgi:hypothetical protein
MNITNNIGILLPAINLVTAGLVGAFGISRSQFSILAPILTVVTGVLVYIGN